ncbi:MAG: TlpA disulfide reductase family protein [Chitinophagaceae bacterium]
MIKAKNILKPASSFSYLVPHTSYLFLSILISACLYGQPKIGEKTPNIALRDVKGGVRRLSEYSNKVVLVDFWASWCGPCRRSNPNLVRLYAKYKAKGFEIYGVSIDEDKAAWKKAIAKDNISWTQVIEVGAWDGRVASAWKVEQLPTSYLLSKSGIVVAVDPFGKDLEHKIVKQLSR